MAYVTKKVQRRISRPFTARAVGRIARYSRDDGETRQDVLASVMLNLGYNADCIYESLQKLFREKLAAVSELKDLVSSAISVLEILLASSIFLKVFSILRRPLQALLTTLKVADKLLDGMLEAFDACADFYELEEVIKQNRGKTWQQY